VRLEIKSRFRALLESLSRRIEQTVVTLSLHDPSGVIVLQKSRTGEGEAERGKESRGVTDGKKELSVLHPQGIKTHRARRGRQCRTGGISEESRTVEIVCLPVGGGKTATNKTSAELP